MSAPYRQPPDSLPARDPAVPSRSAASATGPLSGDILDAELPSWKPNLPTGASDFQGFVNQVVELAQILTGAGGSAIAFRGDQGTICRARSGDGAPPLGALVDSTSGISKQCLDTGTSLCCDDIGLDGHVHSEIAHPVEVRAVAVVPIYNDGEISGILEVVSSVPGIFTDQHLTRLQRLAHWVGTAADMLSEKPICASSVNGNPNTHPDITLLVELEPAYRVFFRNLADLVSLRSPADLAGSSREMDGWNYVLVDSQLPWYRFLESVFLHLAVVGMLAGLSKLGPPEVLVSPPPPREAHITYYPFSQSFPARESSRPAEHPPQQPTSAPPEVIRDRDREPRVASGIGAAHDEPTTRALDTPPPAMPTLGINRLREPGLGAVALPPPPDLNEAETRQSYLPNVSVVAPSPDLSGGSGSRAISAPRAAVVPPSPDARGLMTRAGLAGAGQIGGGSAEAADISIVPPPPSINDHAVLTYGAAGVISKTGVQVVAPPPSIQARATLDGRAEAFSPQGGGSQVVPPPPSLESAGTSVGGGRANSLAGDGSQVAPPPPSMQNAGNYGGGGRISSLAHATSQVVPPPPLPQEGGGGGSSSVGGRASSLAHVRAEGVSPPESAQGAGNSKPGGARAGKDASDSSLPESGANRMHPIVQDVQLRVIGLAWAPPRSSYFSNFEVFFAEKWLNKEESQFIKLVYVFLPYQRRLSEYGLDELNVRRLRVTRDSSCDESLMQMTWREGENGPPGSHQSTEALASSDRNSMLPCYRTTADDYRRAVSRRR